MASGTLLSLSRRLRRGVENVVEIARFGRLSPADSEPFTIRDRGEHHRLRHYGPLEGRPDVAPLLLVPPLMLTAEIYDVAPDLSAVGLLRRAGMDPWVVDFGAPEDEEGGMARTLDDHVRSVASALARTRELTGRDVHVAGYSQGGMFAYEAAALAHSEGIASVITFGSPVDIHKNLPNVGSDVARRLLRAVAPVVEMPLDRIEGLPGALTSLGFKMLTPRKELQQVADFVRKLHDRQALAKRESRRRFLGGEGFVSWPGPALRRFFDDFIVHNRLVSGGLVIDGRTVTLRDIRCPVLYFLGHRDDFARPPAVRAILAAAPNAECHEIVLRAGHFGLVVGSTSLRDTWPAVAEWIRWRDDDGPEPRLLKETAEDGPWHDEPEELFEVDLDVELVTDELSETIKTGWRRLGDAYRDASDTIHGLRHQLPRLWQLERMTGATRVSPSLSLARQARRIGEDTFFLWKGRAFSYREANERVDRVVRGLVTSGVRAGDRVGVLMGVRPSHLSLVTALGRLGAVAMLLSPELTPDALAEALRDETLVALATDPEHLARGCDAFDGAVLLLGGAHDDRKVGDRVVDMERIEPATVTLPGWYRPDPGVARDLALIVARPGPGERPKLSRISNGRWAFSALGVSSAATLTPEDTVYCCLPLHHPSGIMVSVGGALVSGARLALSPRFDPETLWDDARLYGATVVFYAGEMSRALVDAPPKHGERRHPVRLFAGSGMRKDVWERLHERFGVGVLEFYASTERNLVLANASGEKLGALGRRLPGSTDIALVSYDFEREQLRQLGGRLRRSDVDEPGVVLARVAEHVDGANVLRDVFTSGDRWLVTPDVLRRDRDGDYWFVDRLANMVRTAAGAVATPKVEDALMVLPEVTLAVAYGMPTEHGQQVVAVLQSNRPLDPARITRQVDAALQRHERPVIIRRVTQVRMTEGFRPIKTELRNEAPGAGDVLQEWAWIGDRYQASSSPGG
jgi:putative long chain acyl-CoA synthase